MGRGHEAGHAQRRSLHEVKPEMLIKPRPPGRAHRIAGLQNAAQARAGSAAHQPKVAAMRMRHQFENDAALAVALGAEHDAFVDPFHDRVFTQSLIGKAALYWPWFYSLLLLGEFEPHCAVAFRVVGPSFPHFDVEKKMHRLLDRRGDFGTRGAPDCLERLAAFAEDDFALALALDIEGLLNARRAVLELFPDLGLDRRLIRQFLMQAQIELFPCDLCRQLAQRRVRNLVW